MSFPSVFPILKLPILCIESILNQFEIYDKINVSLLSKKCHWILKRLTKPNLLCLNIQIEKHYAEVIFVLKTNQNYGSWIFDFGELEKLTPIQHTINGCNMDYGEHLRFYPFRFADPQQTLNSAVAYFIDLFNIHVRRVNLAPDEIPDTRKFIFPGCNQCEEMKITGNIPFKKYILKHYLENIKITECLAFDIPFESNFYLDPIHFLKDEIHFLNSSANWITRDVFFNLKNQRIQLYECDISKVNVKDFELFVDRWYHSNDTEFELLVMKWKVFPGRLDIKRFNPMPLDKNKRSPKIRLQYGREIDCSRGKDIERSDGLLATVSKRNNHMFLFYVWKDRFPKLASDDAA